VIEKIARQGIAMTFTINDEDVRCVVLEDKRSDRLWMSAAGTTELANELDIQALLMCRAAELYIDETANA